FGLKVPGFTPKVDILPRLKLGDSYCAHPASSRNESLRWVPAAGGIAAPLTSQAQWACPALRMLIAPTRSACSFWRAGLRDEPSRRGARPGPAACVLLGQLRGLQPPYWRGPAG